MKDWAVTFVTATSVLSAIQSAAAMPCDTGYACASKSGRYSVSLRRCRYQNDLRLLDVSIGGKVIADATLGPAYDGGILAFEIELPPVNEDQRILTIEIPRPGRAGLIRERTQASNPGPFKTVASESITCTVTE